MAAKVNDATFLCLIKSGFPYATSSEPCQCVFSLNITCYLLCWCGCFVGREGAWAKWGNRKAPGQGWTARSWGQCGWGSESPARGGEGPHEEEGCRGKEWALRTSSLWCFPSLNFLNFCLFYSLLNHFRKNTETPCQPQAFSSRSFGCVRCALLTLVSMTTTVVWLTILAGSFTSASFRSEKNWTS